MAPTRFFNTFDVDVNADIPSGAVPTTDVNSSINTSFYKFGGGSLRPAVSVDIPCVLNWLNVFSVPSGEEVKVSFWFMHDTVRGLAYTFDWRYAGSNECRVFLVLKYQGPGDIAKSDVHAYDSAGVLRVNHADTVGVVLNQGDWHSMDVQGHWNTSGGALSVKLDGAHVGASPYDISGWSRSHANGLIDLQTTLDNVAATHATAIYIDHLLFGSEPSDGRPLTLGAPLGIPNNLGR